MFLFNDIQLHMVFANRNRVTILKVKPAEFHASMSLAGSDPDPWAYCMYIHSE